MPHIKIESTCPRASSRVDKITSGIPARHAMSSSQTGFVPPGVLLETSAGTYVEERKSQDVMVSCQIFLGGMGNILVFTFL